MADRTDNLTSGSQSANDEGSGPLAGQRLAQARRSHDIALAEVAKALHLDEQQVQALEENQFEVLGAPVFAKGHLKKYADLVGVKVEDVLADYYKLNRAAGAPPVVDPKHKRQREVEIGPWIVGAVAIIIVGGGFYWWMGRDESVTSDPAEQLEAPAAAQETEEAVDETDDGATEDATTVQLDTPNDTEMPLTAAPTNVESVDDEPAAEAESEPIAEAPAELPASADTQPAAPSVEIVMAFSGDCWTEVTDGDGSRLFFGLGEAGRVITRRGTPPLQALFGDRNNVTLTVNGESFELRGSSRSNTARVTIDP